jgi:hypothetical protein
MNVLVTSLSHEQPSHTPVHARHLIRLRRRHETIHLRDAIPEIVFLNSHDGTSAHQLRVESSRDQSLLLRKLAICHRCVTDPGACG